ncbi:MAG: PA2778 family cysteine peptidase [Proteobacteria bacterium]|nr:PA2778 family cysteine peptidase [Pseudomonadota bacterium]
MGPGPLNQISASVPPQVHLTSVPFFAQKAYQCGPATLAMALQWSGVSITPDDLKPEVYTPGRKGSLQSGLVTSARRHERLAYGVQGLDCLIREVAAGHPVIVLQNLGLDWLPRWHYGVVVGYDLHEKHIVLNTGLTMARRVRISTFYRTWKRADQWGLLVLAAGHMPVCVEEKAYLKAALGLQQAGHHGLALTAFRAAAGRWFDSAGAQVVLGNALYADGALSEAAHSFRRAIAIDSNNAAAFNNLAHVMAQLGELEQAEAMAYQAVETGGAHQDLYRQTLEEILHQRKMAKER